MARRRVAVEFIAELGQFKRGTRDGADEVRKMKNESKAAQAEVAKLGKASVQAQSDMKRFANGRRQLVDLGAAARSLRQDVSNLADRSRRLANNFAAVNGSAAAALATFRRIPAAVQAAGRSIRNVNLGQAAQTAQATAQGVGQIGGAAPLSTVVGLAAIPAAAGAAAASLQTIPPLLVTIGGGLGAIPGLAAGAAAGIGTLKLATVGLGDAIEEVFETPDGADPYDRLSKSGKQFVDVLASQKAALLGVQQVAQERTFANLDGELQMLGAVAIPFATRQVERFGDTWNQTFRQLARVGRSPQFLAGIDAAAEGADRFFDNVNTRIGPTSRSLAQLFIGSRPFVDAFGDSLLGHLDDFNAWIDRTASNGDLEDFFADAAVQADALLDIGKEVLVLVGRIGGLPYGRNVLRDMADALERFNDEAHNMRSVEGVIATGNAAIRGLIDVLLILGETLGETLADPATRDAVAAFFDILKIAAQIVGGLVTAFGALPGPVQSTVLVIAALAILFGKLYVAAGRMQQAVGKATGQLNQMGPAGQRAGRGLQTATLWAGRAVVALAALQVAGMALDALSDSAVKVDALNRSLKDFVQTGELGGELTRQFGEGLEELDNRARGAGDGWFPKLGRAIEAVLPPAKSFNELFFGGSFTGDVERFRELDAQLRQIAETTGDVNGVGEAFRKLFNESGLTVAEFNKLLPETAAWLTEAQARAHGTSATQQALNGSMEDAISIIGSYTRAWKELNGAALGTDEALLAAKDALDDVKESFKENGKAIEGNSRAALENRVMVGRFAEAAAEAAQKKYEETGSIEASNAVYAEQIRQLRATLAQMGLLPPEIDRLIGKYGKIPPTKKTTITVEKKQAEDNLTYIKRLADAIKSKTVVITVQRNEVVTRSEGRNVPIGNVGGRRWGGITEHAQTGLLREADMFAAASSRRYAFAEAETGGEAFIPKFGARDRSISIGRRAMEWYGMDVVPHGGMSKAFLAGMTTGAASPTKVTVPPLDLAALTSAIRSAMVGVSVQLDGRTVGYITGREANVYSRA